MNAGVNMVNYIANGATINNGLQRNSKTDLSRGNNQNSFNQMLSSILMQDGNMQGNSGLTGEISGININDLMQIGDLGLYKENSNYDTDSNLMSLILGAMQSSPEIQRDVLTQLSTELSKISGIQDMSNTGYQGYQANQVNDILQNLIGKENALFQDQTGASATQSIKSIIENNMSDGINTAENLSKDASQIMNTMQNSMAQSAIKKNEITSPSIEKAKARIEQIMQLREKIHSQAVTTANENMRSNGTEVVEIPGLKEIVLNVKTDSVDIDNIDNVDVAGSMINKQPIIDSRGNVVIEVSDQSSKTDRQVMTQVKDKILLMAKDGDTQQVTMQLSPENLGKINIKMAFEAGKLTVEIMALNEKTQSMLMLNSSELKGMLQQSTGVNNSSVHVTVTENSLDQYSRDNPNYNGNNQTHEQNDQNNNQKSTYEAYDFEENEENSLIAEMINLRNMKLGNTV